MADDTPYLHLYTQGAWHDDAHIVGTWSGLAKLRDALQVALALAPGPAQVADGLFCADGEGFCIRVVLAREEDMPAYAAPYTEEIARERDGDPAVWPRKKRGA